MKKIIVATGNQGKMKEIERIFTSDKYELLSLKEIGFTKKVAEDQDNFEGNALKKAITVMQSIHEITLADDSGLEVDKLNGEPGISSARFAGEGARDIDNNNKLLGLMKNVPLGERGAQFRCVMVLVFPNGNKLTSEGICRGTISYEAYGDSGFGYDPIFIPEGYNKTFAQIGNGDKNKISHRAIALNNMKELIKNIF